MSKWILAALLVAASLSCASSGQREAEDKADAETALRQLEAVARGLPSASELRAIACPAALAERDLGYSPVDPGYFAQFTDSGFVPQEGLPQYRTTFGQLDDYTGVWYQAVEFGRIQHAVMSAPRRDREIARGYHDLRWKGGGSPSGKGLMLEGVGHFVVVYADLERLPEIGNYPGPGEVTLAPGQFQGWAVLVDPATADVLCIAPFHASNSESPTFRLGEDPLSVAFQDFRSEFSRSLEAALGAQGARLKRYTW